MKLTSFSATKIAGQVDRFYNKFTLVMKSIDLSGKTMAKQKVDYRYSWSPRFVEKPGSFHDKLFLCQNRWESR